MALFKPKMQMERVVSAAAAQELPIFFQNYLWNYVDALSLEVNHLDDYLYFDIQQDARHLNIKFHQERPAFEESFALRLIANEFWFPQKITIENRAHFQEIYLPEEVQSLGSFGKLND